MLGLRSLLASGMKIDSPPSTPSARSYKIFVDRRTSVERYLSYCFHVCSALIGKVWWVSFGWWLDPIGQRRRNNALLNDVQANLDFLCSRGEPILEKHLVVHPFDYASVTILFGNVYYCFTRGRGELNVTVAPRQAPTHSRELSLVIAALDSARREPIGPDFGSIRRKIRSHLASLDQAFSEERYPDFEKRLP